MTFSCGSKRSIRSMASSTSSRGCTWFVRTSSACAVASRSVRESSTVDQDRLSADELGIVTKEVAVGTEEIVGFHHPAEGSGSRVVRAEHGGAFRRRETGPDAVDTDLLRAELEGQRLGNRNDGTLRGDVVQETLRPV